MKKLNLLAVSGILFWLLEVGVFVTYGQEITVGKNIQVSAQRSAWWHDEMMLAVDPTDSRRMIATSIVMIPQQAKRSTVIYASGDGGKTWTPTLDTTYLDHTSDPACVYGEDGTAYYLAEIAMSSGGIELYRSKDGGRTWPPNMKLHLDKDKWPRDRPWFAVDRSKTSPYYGRVYIATTMSVGQVGYGVNFTADNGFSWSPIVLTNDNFSDEVALGSWPGNCDVASDGFLACVMDRGAKSQSDNPVPWWSRPYSEITGWIGFVTSVDGGNKFSPFQSITRIPQHYTSLPHLAIDHSTTAFRDRIYVTWGDARTGRTEIYLAYSADRGKTWSSPVKVSDDLVAPGVNKNPWQTMPDVAVTPDGIVGVFWYDRRDDATGAGFMPRFAASLDGGETFMPSIAVSEKPKVVSAKDDWPLDFGQSGKGSPLSLNWSWYRKHVFGGESLGFVASGPGTFRALWPDNRTGVDQLWTAPIVVRGQAKKNGSEELSSLQDVSSQVAMDVVRYASDFAHETFSLIVRLRNTGTTPISGPLKGRVVFLSATGGPLFVTNSDNKMSHLGAMWDFTALLQGQSLGPGEFTGEKVLQFRFPIVQPLLRPQTVTDDPRLQIGDFNMKLRILAGVK
jgi:hypothetical protein